MAEPVMGEPPPAPDPNPYVSSEFDSLPIPPMDHLFLSGSNGTPNETLDSDLGFTLDENGEFELTFEGFDDLYFPAENEPFLIPSSAANHDQSGNFTPESEGSGVSGDRVLEDVDKYLNCWSSESVSCNRESPQESAGGFSGAEKSSDVPSPVSSQGSGNCGSGVFEAMNASSPESGNLVVEQKVKVEEVGIPYVTKRKNENEDSSGESRSSKYHKSSDYAASCAATSEEEEKRKSRLMRNRESAQLSRQRKKHYVEELEEKVRSMHSTIAELNGKISYFMAENATLRQQLGGGAGMCPPPHPPAPGMYPPMAPMPYPWMPCPPYVVKAQGSQVPLIPIPRLKTHQPVSASKAKKSVAKKSEAKTKKVASISFLGLVFLIFLFGGLAPIVNVKYGGISDGYQTEYRSSYITDRFYDQHRGKVLAVDGHLNASNSGIDVRSANINRAHCEKPCDGESGRAMSGTGKSVPMGNNSESLVASLFVPRNNKLVKIDGNLIIHSVLASEKAMASRKVSETNNDRKTGLTIAKDLSPALPVVGRNGGMAKHLYRNGKHKALSSGSADNLKDHFKSTAADGKMQQWFREGVVGPMLGSGMCTEVFQFDVSPTSGAIVPASSATNVSSERCQNTTHGNKGKNRRFLRGIPVPLPGPNFNITKDHIGNASRKESFQEKKPGSSVVVSVLVDPREGGEGDIDGKMVPKSLSRIFVVVLVDSVKYVTYSCVLPGSGGPYLVTT